MGMQKAIQGRTAKKSKIPLEQYQLTIRQIQSGLVHFSPTGAYAQLTTDTLLAEVSGDHRFCLSVNTHHH